MGTDFDIDMADLASLDGPASSAATAAPSTRFAPNLKGKGKPKAKPKPKPKPKPVSEPEPIQEDEPHAAAAALPEDSVDAMETDGVGASVAADEMDHEDEDFVVREIDVYFTPKPFDEDTMLYIMQYPLRPCWRPYELNEICKEVRVKPCSSKVEVDLDINTESDNYDPEASASLRLTKQTLSSSKAADVTDYAVGVLRGNLVHLNHIDGVMQLRPSTSHLNSGGSHTRQPLQQVETNVGTGGPTIRSVKAACAKQPSGRPNKQSRDKDSKGSIIIRDESMESSHDNRQTLKARIAQAKRPRAGVKRPRAGVDVEKKFKKMKTILDARISTTDMMMASILEICGPIAGNSLGPVQTSGGDGKTDREEKGARSNPRTDELSVEEKGNGSQGEALSAEKGGNDSQGDDRSMASPGLGDASDMQDQGEEFAPSRSVASPRSGNASDMHDQGEKIAPSNATPHASCEANTSHHADLASSPSSNSNGAVTPHGTVPVKGGSKFEAILSVVRVRNPEPVVYTIKKYPRCRPSYEQSYEKHVLKGETNDNPKVTVGDTSVTAKQFVNSLKEGGKETNEFVDVCIMAMIKDWKEKRKSTSLIIDRPTVGNERSDGSKDCAEESEPWISLTYEPAGSDVASNYYTEMVANDGRPIDFTMSTSDYAMSLCPGGPTGSKNINRCHALREMLLLPLEERLKKWFTEVSQVNRFDALIHLAPAYSEEDVLKVLPVYADLVRGLWVCRSSLLYDDGHASKRDRILLEFTKKESISTNYVDKLFRDVRTRNMILSPLGKRREKLKDYKFIVAADSSFIKCYPHIVREQENTWSVREATMSDPLETCSTTEGRKTKMSARSNIPVKGPDPIMGKTRDGLVQGSENYVRSVLDSVFTANKVRSFQAIVRDLRHLAAKYASDRKDGARFQALSNAAQTCVSLSRNELHASIKVVAAPVHDVYVQKTEERATMRNVLIRLFIDKGASGTLKKQEILDNGARMLKRTISDKEYHQAVTDICVTNDEGHLVLKNGDKP